MVHEMPPSSAIAAQTRIFGRVHRVSRSAAGSSVGGRAGSGSGPAGRASTVDPGGCDVIVLLQGVASLRVVTLGRGAGARTALPTGGCSVRRTADPCDEQRAELRLRRACAARASGAPVRGRAPEPSPTASRLCKKSLTGCPLRFTLSVSGILDIRIDRPEGDPVAQEEKVAWIGLVVGIVTGVVYGVVLAARAAGGPLVEAPYVDAMLWSIGIGIIVTAVVTIVVAILT